MTKLKKIGGYFMVGAIVGICGFWGMGFADKMDMAAYFLIGAGVCAWGALCSWGLAALRRRNGFC